MLAGCVWRMGAGAGYGSGVQLGQGAMWVCVVFLEMGRLERWECLLRLKSELEGLLLGDWRFILLMDILGWGDME
jgi:hypothetical protein